MAGIIKASGSTGTSRPREVPDCLLDPRVTCFTLRDMMRLRFEYGWILIILTLSIWSTTAFVPASCGWARDNGLHSTVLGAERAVHSDHFLLQEFSIHTGEILNPYKVLGVSRAASTSVVRDSYVKLSRRYHPDVVRHKDILPGSCNNLDEVRDEWERIKLSYEILRNDRTRKRYDRHEALADPKGAVGRAAVGAVGNGLAGVGKGLFSMGAHAMRQMSNKKVDEDTSAP